MKDANSRRDWVRGTWKLCVPSLQLLWCSKINPKVSVYLKNSLVVVLTLLTLLTQLSRLEAQWGRQPPTLCLELGGCVSLCVAVCAGSCISS